MKLDAAGLLLQSAAQQPPEVGRLLAALLCKLVSRLLIMQRCEHSPETSPMHLQLVACILGGGPPLNLVRWTTSQPGKMDDASNPLIGSFRGL